MVLDVHDVDDVAVELMMMMMMMMMMLMMTMLDLYSTLFIVLTPLETDISLTYAMMLHSRHNAQENPAYKAQKMNKTLYSEAAMPISNADIVTIFLV